MSTYTPRNVETLLKRKLKDDVRAELKHCKTSAPLQLTRKKQGSEFSSEVLRLREELEQLKADKAMAETEARRLRAELKTAKEHEIDVRCAICLRDTPCSPVVGCPKGHVFCAECIYRWGTVGRKIELNTNPDGCHPLPTIKDPLYRCPSCRVECDPLDLKYRSRLPAAVLAFADPAVCPHCDCEVARGEGQHIFQCPAEKVTCPQCSKRVAMGRLQHHVFEECDQFSCKVCVGGTTRFTLDRLHDHMNVHDSVRDTILDVLQNWPNARTAIEGIHGRQMRQSEYTGTHFYVFFLL
jgi:hypothetical protein